MSIPSNLPFFGAGTQNTKADDSTVSSDSFAQNNSDVFTMKSDGQGKVVFVWNLGGSSTSVPKNYREFFAEAYDPSVDIMQFSADIHAIEFDVLGSQISQVTEASKKPAVYYSEADKISNDLKQGSASGDSSGLGVLTQEKDAVFTLNCFVSWLEAVNSNPELLKSVFKDSDTYSDVLSSAQKLLDGKSLNQDEMTKLNPVFLKFMDSFVPPELRPDVLPSTVQQLHQKNDQLVQGNDIETLAGF